MINRFRLWLRVYRQRGTATLPFWMWLKWALFGKPQSGPPTIPSKHT